MVTEVVEKKASKSVNTAEDDEYDASLRYGWFGFTPDCLQFMATPRALLIVMFIASVFMSMIVNGLIGVIISSVETRFGLDSTSSSWIASTYDVASVPMLILISYFAEKSHRTRFTFLGLVGVLVGTAIFVLPHFTTPAYDPLKIDSETELLCLPTRNTTQQDTQDDTADSSLYLWVFIAGRILHGLGGTPIFTICVTYLDDCVSKSTFSLYIAIFYASGLMGPAVGYVIGGYMLSIYTNFYDVDHGNSNLSEEDPRWVGAWWLPFLLGGVLLLVSSLPFTGFPRDLPGARAVRAAKVSEAHARKSRGEVDEEDTSDGNVTLKQLPRYLWDLLTNPTYACLTVMNACDSLIVSGFTAFGPYVLQSQFAITSSLAGILFGAVVIPGGGGGSVFGGYLIRRLRMGCASIMKWEIGFSFVVVLAMICLNLNCAAINFAGVNYPYNGTTLVGDTNSTCNANCNCEDVRFQPICSNDNVQYYSPCHAGCQDLPVHSTFTEYYNCSCITPNGPGPAATDDLCTNEDCWYLPLWMVFFFIAIFCIFMISAMNISAIMRCVPSSHRSLAVGVQWISIRLLGTIPGPATFGAVFDMACIKRPETDGSAKCLLYDNSKMSLYLFIVCFCLKSFAIILVGIALWAYRAPSHESAHQALEELKDKTGDSDDARQTGRSLQYILEDDEERIRKNGHVSAAFEHDDGSNMTQETFTKF